jgi:type IV pilus assembly protein PilM
MAKTVVGVDVSANGLRAVELGNVAKGKPVVLRQHSVGLPVGAVSRGEVIEQSTVSTALKQLWSLGGFKGKDVVLGIGNSRVFARNLTVPRMSLKLIRESLPFQVQEMIPFPTEDAVLDFYPISESQSESGPVVNGLLVAALREAVLGNVTAVQRAGLNPIEVDLVPFALSRILLYGTKSVGTTAIVDVGASTTTVVISTDGVPQFVRIIPSGGDDLTASLARRLNVSPEQAEMMKRAVGLSTASQRPEERNVAAVVLELASELMTSLRTTLTYFAASEHAPSIGQIVVTGGGGLLPGFTMALSEYTRIPVSLGDPLQSVMVTDRAKQGAFANGGGSAFTVAIGLALGAAA